MTCLCSLPSYIRFCIVIVLCYVFIGLFAPVFYAFAVFGLLATVFNSVSVNKEQSSYRERGLLRYMHGEWKERQGEYE